MTDQEAVAAVTREPELDSPPFDPASPALAARDYVRVNRHATPEPAPAVTEPTLEAQLAEAQAAAVKALNTMRSYPQGSIESREYSRQMASAATAQESIKARIAKRDAAKAPAATEPTLEAQLADARAYRDACQSAASKACREVERLCAAIRTRDTDRYIAEIAARDAAKAPAVATPTP